MPRREFSRKLKAEIILRSRNADGEICCEGCGLVLAGKRFEIDHIIAEGIADQSKPLTAEDGQILGKDCCHRAPGGKTAKDQARVAKMKRQRDRASGALKGRPFPRRPKPERPKSDKLPLPARHPGHLMRRGELMVAGRGDTE